MLQLSFLYLKMPLKSAFLIFFFFWNDNSLLILKLFISEYLDLIPPWKEIKEAFSVNFHTENLLLKIKLKDSPDCPNNEYNAILNYIHENIRADPRCKKNLHWLVIGKLLLHIGTNSNKSEAMVDKFGLF